MRRSGYIYSAYLHNIKDRKDISILVYKHSAKSMYISITLHFYISHTYLYTDTFNDYIIQKVHLKYILVEIFHRSKATKGWDASEYHVLVYNWNLSFRE